MSKRPWIAGFMKMGLVSSIVIVAFFATFASAASAAEVHVFAGSFGAGELLLAESSGIAVNNQTGDLYIADTGNGRVAQYSSTGTFIRAFGSLPAPTFIAIDNSGGPSQGDVYVADTSTNTVSKFDAAGAPVTAWGTNGILDGTATPGGSFSSLSGIAVGPDGKLYVYCQPFNAELVKLSAEGTSEEEFETEVFAVPTGIAVDSAGDVYLNGLPNGILVKIGGSGPPNILDLEVNKGQNPATQVATLGADAYVAFPGGVARYNSSGSLLETFGAEQLSAAAGIALTDSDTAYVADSGLDEVERFVPILVPDVQTEAPTGIDRTSATLHGTISAAGGPEAKCSFEYTTESAFAEHEFTGATVVPCSPAGPFTGTGSVPVSATIEGLEVGTDYRFRLFGESENGANPNGGVIAFQTNPAVKVEAGQASEVSRGSAALNGSLNPEGAAVESCQFEYVSRAEFQVTEFAAAVKVPCVPSAVDLGAGNTPESVQAVAMGLNAATEYLFRLVASNNFGTTASSISTLFTKPAVNVAITTATSLTPLSAVLNGLINPEGAAVTDCRFEYVTLAAFESEGFASAVSKPCSNAGAIGEESTAVPVEASATGLLPNTVYLFRLVAESSFGSTSSGEERFETLGPPTLESLEALNITTSSALIEATLNPHGQPTTLQVEYVTQAQFEMGGYAEAVIVPVPPKDVGASVGVVTASQGLPDLTAGIGYHFRVVLENPAGAPLVSGDQTFSTFPLPQANLPDGRVYEKVTPAFKIGEPFAPEPSELIDGRSGSGGCDSECIPGASFESTALQAAADGDSIAYQGSPIDPSATTPFDEYQGIRSGTGWSTQSLHPSIFVPVPPFGFLAFSSDLHRGIVYGSGALSPETPISGGKAYADLYLWEQGRLTPLVTASPPQRGAGANNVNGFQLAYGGANSGTGESSAFSHVVFAANDSLTPSTDFAPVAPTVGPSNGSGSGCRLEDACNLYEWSDGELRLVNVLPGNTEAADGPVVVGSRLSEEEAPNVEHAISDDGSRIFWSDGAGNVYVRINGQETKKIEDPGHGRYLDASVDGSQVLLGDGCLYSVALASCEDLTGGHGGLEGVLGASDDLSRIYFVDTAVLDETANQYGDSAEEGAPNLYLWSGGVASYIATLLPSDNNNGSATSPKGFGPWRQYVGRRTARVTPNGEFAVFMSRADLTGYNNSPRGSGACRGEDCYEVFEYRAASNSLICPSCNPSGQRPLGESVLSIMHDTQARPRATIYPPMNLPINENGRLFFESQDALTAGDQNGRAQDIYEWEPKGAGDCKVQSGCVSLISSGSAEEDSFFMASTPSGNDVYFITRQALLPSDRDALLDIYDARVGGGISESVKTDCSEGGGESCKGPVSPPPVVLNPGHPPPEGNRKRPACRHGKVRRHGRCVSRKASQGHHHKAKHGTNQKGGTK